MSGGFIFRNNTRFLVSLLCYVFVSTTSAQHNILSDKTSAPKKNLDASFNEASIYFSPSQPMSIGCPNAGFEQYDFSNWSGSTGTVSPGSTFPNYNTTGFSIINTAGSNTSVLNTVNYHSIMSVPPSNPVYPNCVGYDSLACRTVGSQTVSQIPFKSPYSFDPVSVRMNGAVAGKRASKLKFITTAGPYSKRLSYSYALVFQDPGTGATHDVAGEAPYFKVTVRNETTNTDMPGCVSFSYNAASAQPGDSLKRSITASGDTILYRKWHYYSVDLSSLPPGTNVSINFEVGGCANGDHFGYAYVDAECGGTGTTYASMCSGSTVATLVAPSGFNSYQWFNSSGIIPGATNDTLTVNPATVGSVYTVNITSPGGCVITQTVQISLTTVSLINLNSTSSCAGGNSGTAFVQASGSSGSYSYTWTSTSGSTNGTNVSYSQTATGLPPGTYSVVVASANCGQASANLSVGFSPPFYNSMIKQFCGNAAYLTEPYGSDYTWYHGNVLIPPPLGNKDTLFLNNAVNGEYYTLVYKNSFGCRDSLKYQLQKIEGGSSYFSNLTNVCPAGNNGSVILNVNSPNPGPFNYYVSGPNTGNTIISATTSTRTLSISFLSAGTYTAIVKDGPCVYNNTVTVSTIQTNFTVTPTHTVLCFPAEKVTLNLSIDEVSPAACSLYSAVCSGNTPVTLFSSGTFTQNASSQYPAVYGNALKCGRTQFLVKKSELNSAGINAGKISSLAFNILNLNSSVTTYTNFSISMGCTGLTALPDASSSPQAFIPGLQTVYANSTQTLTTGWMTHNFNQSYVWDGVSNLIIEICYGTPSQLGTTENVSVELNQMGYIAAMYHVESVAMVCGGSQPADNAGGTAMINAKNMLPNMKFGYCPYATLATGQAVSVSSNGTITNNYNNDSIVVVPTFTAPPVPNAPTVYTITLTNPEGSCTTSHTVSVLYPSINVSVTATPIKDSLCEGASTSFSVSGASSYIWSYNQGGTLVPFSTATAVTVTPPVSGTNTYVVTGSNPCPNSIADTKTVTVKVTPKASLSITPLQDASKCMGKQVVFNTNVSSVTPGNNGMPYTYAWTTLPGNIAAPGNNTSPSYTATINSTTTLVITVNGACAYTASDTVVVENLADDLSVSILDTSTTCGGKPFTLNAVATGGHPAYSYYWFIYPNSTSISNSPSVTYNSPEAEGTYTVTVYVADSCNYSRADFELIRVLPACNVIIPNVITPNGDNANEYFKIKNIEHHPNTSLTIFDRWGNKIYENSNYNNEWKAEGVVDGTYFYIVDVPEDKKYSGFITVFKQN
jgi:gliding motility-associated-like protein